jgi:NADP-dependent 3-hydroxy acid dehydrogenase YdfG
VVATARRAEELASLAAEASGPGKVIAAPADVTEEAALAAAIARIEAEHGPIARAFLNAGLYLPVRARPFEASKFHKSFAVNLGGVVNGLAAILPGMMARGAGQIAINASVAGYSGLPTSAAYGATKAGLINMAESLKFDCDNAGVLVQIVNPGFVKTPATDTNPFPMPFLQEVEIAARRVLEGMDRAQFEITFPRRFAYILKALGMLPYPVYFALLARATGWKGKRD